MGPGTPPFVVVFSAVDGVLRAPTRAALARARHALSRLHAEHAALVLCSNSTRAEVELMQQQLGLVHPFTVEGGAALFVPRADFGRPPSNARRVAGYDMVEFGLVHADVLGLLRRTADRLGIRIAGFADMSVEEVARDFELTLLRARLAKLREYVEPCRPFYTTTVDRLHLLKALEAAKLSAVRRGSYEYVGSLTDARMSIQALATEYRAAFGPLLTIGLADSESDDGVLTVTDRQVIVCDDAAAGCAVDLACWAESLLDMVSEARARRSVTPALFASKR